MSSRLGDIENAIVGRLTGAIPGTTIEFADVVTIGGGNRLDVRDAIKRLRMPALLVGFVDEPRGPETRDIARGARFSVFVADRALRQGSSPSIGDTTTDGTYALIDVVSGQLANYDLGSGLRLIETQIRSIESNERTAIHEISFRAWPIREAPPQILTFDGDTITGPASRFVLEVDPIRFEFVPNTAGGSDTFAIVPREVRWNGELEAATHGALNALEETIETLVVDRIIATITSNDGRSLEGCAIDRYQRRGPRMELGTAVAQAATIIFTQLDPEP